MGEGGGAKFFVRARNVHQVKGPENLQFPNAVVLNAVRRRNTQMSAQVEMHRPLVRALTIEFCQILEVVREGVPVSETMGDVERSNGQQN